MAQETAIQWCDSTCNPSMGCDGCELWDGKRRSCYAGRLHETRGRGIKGFAPSFDAVTPFPGRTSTAASWSDLRSSARPGKPWLDGLPRLIFVSDMGDSLSQTISFEYLLEEVVSAAESENGKRHIWQWLTKRPHRMAEFSTWLKGKGRQWPVNLWVGTSITTSSTRARIAKLLCVGDETTTRFLSVEPQIEEVDLWDHLRQLDWIIQGGESGKDARPFDLGWARKLRAQCREVRVPYFLKQLGAVVVDEGRDVAVRDPHGGDWSEWPEDLRVRELPHGKEVRRLFAQMVAQFEQDELEPPHAAHQDAAVPESEAPLSERDEGFTEPLRGDVDPLDGAGVESELNALIGRLADDMSELAMIALLPRAKQLYEQLHPETRHGGRRDQVARSATWPSFAAYVAAHSGISMRTVYARLETAEQLATLDSAAEAACFGTGLSNQVGLLVRIARLPTGEEQRDLVAIYRSAGPKRMKEALRKRENELGIAAKPKEAPEPESSQPESPESASPGTERESSPAANVGHEDNDPELDRIVTALGVADIDECLPAIEALKGASATANELRQRLAQSEAARKRLEREIGLYRDAPMGQLFQLLGVKNVKDALGKVRSLTEASSAAE